MCSKCVLRHCMTVLWPLVYMFCTNCVWHKICLWLLHKFLFLQVGLGMNIMSGDDAAEGLKSENANGTFPSSEASSSSPPVWLSRIFLAVARVIFCPCHLAIACNARLKIRPYRNSALKNCRLLFQRMSWRYIEARALFLQWLFAP